MKEQALGSCLHTPELRGVEGFLYSTSKVSFVILVILHVIIVIFLTGIITLVLLVV